MTRHMNHKPFEDSSSPPGGTDKKRQQRRAWLLPCQASERIFVATAEDDKGAPSIGLSIRASGVVWGFGEGAWGL